MKPTIFWKNNAVHLIDQTLLPHQYKVIACRDLKKLWHAIKTLKVRGAPAIGMAAGYAVQLAAVNFKGEDARKMRKDLLQACRYIATSRPTAVNLFNVLNAMRVVINDESLATTEQIRRAIVRKAKDIYELDRRTCRLMGAHGAKLIQNGKTYMTVCNAGALATVDYGTALGVFYSAKAKGKKFAVTACETRPLLQGARLTTWELLRAKIPTTLICDNMAATMMKQGKIHGIFTGADRIASNGDAANKIGTYSLAVLAKYHKIPFYVVAPFSTFDMAIRTGRDIPIEERAKEEVLGYQKVRWAPSDVQVFNPAFDVTGNRLITAIITEGGVIKPPFRNNITKAIEKSITSK